MNLPANERLDIVLDPEARKKLESALLPTLAWEQRKEEMPAPCRDVVSGAAFYCGCEGIGHTAETGWFLVLWEPIDPPAQEQAVVKQKQTFMDFVRWMCGMQRKPIISLVSAAVCPNSGESTLTLLFMEHLSPEAELHAKLAKL